MTMTHPIEIHAADSDAGFGEDIPAWCTDLATRTTEKLVVRTRTELMLRAHRANDFIKSQLSSLNEDELTELVRAADAMQRHMPQPKGYDSVHDEMQHALGFNFSFYSQATQIKLAVSESLLMLMYCLLPA